MAMNNIKLQRHDIDGVQERCALSRHGGRRNSRLAVRGHRLQEVPVDPDDQTQVWAINRRVSHELADGDSNGGLFVLMTMNAPKYALSLSRFQQLELRLVRAEPYELRCESLQWREIDDGVIIKPAAIVRQINNIVNN